MERILAAILATCRGLRFAERYAPRPRDQVTIACMGLGLICLWLLGETWQGNRLVGGPLHGGGRISFQVDVNRADWPELIALPRIGPVLAKRIVEDRRGQGPYRRVDDLQRVRGIGPHTVARLRPFVIATWDLRTQDKTEQEPMLP